MGEYSELLTREAVYLIVKLLKQGPAMSFYCPCSGREKLYDVLFKTLQGPGCEGLPPASANGQTWRMLFNSASFLFAFLPLSLLVFVSAGLVRWRGVGYGWYICEASWSEVLTWQPSPQACD
jgi:hypothetical protein